MTISGLQFWQVDAFTATPFAGNPAAVFVVREPLPDMLMQKLAQEINLSETVFVLLNAVKPLIRWFTPNTEVSLCGHATLAAAHILWTQNFFNDESIVFTSASGDLAVTRQEQGYTLDFPAQPAVVKPEHLAQATSILGQAPLYAASNEHDLMVVVKDAVDVKTAMPDLAMIAQLPERGFLLTAADETGAVDFIYRAFFPKLNVPEDPVTGSALTALAPYWAEALGKTTLRARQVSSRGGDLVAAVAANRILISGQAITIFESKIIT